jgi:hypothetical protein
MSTYREIVYMVLDELKEHSDDAYYTEDHIIFLATNWRAALLEKKYPTNKKDIPSENYIEICLDVEETEAIDGSPCGSVYLKTTKKIPSILRAGYPKIYPVDYFSSEYFTYVPKERFPYAGFGNKWLQNIIYATKGTDGYLYIKSANPQFLHIEKIKAYAVFADPKEAYKLSCDNEACDILDMEFPLETNLIQTCIQMVVSELVNQRYAPEDKANDAKDNLAEVNVRQR